MKHTLLAAALITSSIPLVHAEEVITEEFCIEVNGIATSIMDARQRRNLSLVKALSVRDIAAETHGEDHPILEMYVKMVRDAYRVPRYSTPEIQRSKTAQFAERWTLDCLQVVDGNKR